MSELMRWQLQQKKALHNISPSTPGVFVAQAVQHDPLHCLCNAEDLGVPVAQETVHVLVLQAHPRVSQQQQAE
jgi:hypothetical protein